MSEYLVNAPFGWLLLLIFIGAYLGVLLHLGIIAPWMLSWWLSETGISTVDNFHSCLLPIVMPIAVCIVLGVALVMLWQNRSNRRTAGKASA
ncbi:MAG: hypothetical protein AAF702_11850 [Chloroflexota bacterium]